MCRPGCGDDRDVVNRRQGRITGKRLVFVQSSRPEEAPAVTLIICENVEAGELTGSDGSELFRIALK